MESCTELPLLETVRKAVEGKRILFVGGDTKPHRYKSLQNTLAGAEVVWCTNDKKGGSQQSYRSVMPQLRKADMLVLLVRWMGHEFLPLKDKARELGIPCILARHGLNEGRIVEEFYRGLHLQPQEEEKELIEMQAAAGPRNGRQPAYDPAAGHEVEIRADGPPPPVEKPAWATQVDLETELRKLTTRESDRVDEIIRELARRNLDPRHFDLIPGDLTRDIANKADCGPSYVRMVMTDIRRASGAGGRQGAPIIAAKPAGRTNKKQPRTPTTSTIERIELTPEQRAGLTTKARSLPPPAPAPFEEAAAIEAATSVQTGSATPIEPASPTPTIEDQETLLEMLTQMEQDLQKMKEDLAAEKTAKAGSDKALEAALAQIETEKNANQELCRQLKDVHTELRTLREEPARTVPAAASVNPEAVEALGGVVLQIVMDGSMLDPDRWHALTAPEKRWVFQRAQAVLDTVYGN